MDGFQNNGDELKKPIKKKRRYCMIPFRENSGKCQLIYSDRKQPSDSRGQGGMGKDGEGWRGLDGRGCKEDRKTLAMMGVFTILIAMMVSWMCT